MSWLGLLLIGVALADLAHSVRPVPVVPDAIGGLAVIAVGLLAGLDDPRDVVALVMLAALVVAWAQAVGWGFRRGRPAVPLIVLGLAAAAAVVAAPAAGAAGGPLGDWLAHHPLGVLRGLSADRMLLLTGVFLVQMSTGNVVVRLVLAATGTLPPAAADPAGAADEAGPEQQLKGGRLLGPMERLVILGLGLAGQLTAASIVVAAKGLLRFPELQSRSEQLRIHRLTEYFLVGSFMSWLLALGSLALAR